MFTPKRLLLRLFDDKDQSGLLGDIEKEFSFKKVQSWTSHEEFFDSFDWRLSHKKLLFIISDDRLRLIDSNEQLLFETEVGRAQKYFYWDFVEKSLRSKLRKILGYRAVCPLISVVKTSCDYKVTNKDVKTVANVSTIVYESAGDKRKKLAAFVNMSSIRGYESAFKKIRKIGCRFGVEQETPGLSVLDSLLRTSHRALFDYSSKYSVSIGDDWSVGHVFSVICLHLLDTMKHNIEFILTDTDTEFLHDFRVAIRRTRSFLTLMNKLLPEQVAEYMLEFKWLGSSTGVVRDLDVMLLMKDQYAALLPKTLGDGLAHFFADLKRQRKHAFEIMAADFGSDRFKKLMDDWPHFLRNLPNMGSNVSLHRVCRPEAVKRIRKRFKRICKDGKSINDQSGDECLHDLRIQVKKLRYLLEFFAPYFNQSDVKRFVKQLKKLQTNLGKLNDLSVQQCMLGDYRAGLKRGSKRDLSIAAALGGLISYLAVEQQYVRKNFDRTFSHFIKTKNIWLFERTFL